jgi:Uri superfamily endonuclease
MSFAKEEPPRGTYALLILVQSPLTFQIGMLGEIHLQPGYYIYIGSALGYGGIPGRVNRHLRCPTEKRSHWHIDALTAHGVIEEVWWARGTERHECAWAKVLSNTGNITAPGFGASDCHCPGHLVWFGEAEEVTYGWLSLQKFPGSKLQRAKVETNRMKQIPPQEE